VGLIFDEDVSLGTPRVFVRGIVPGGAADGSRRVRRGDLIVLVDGNDVYGSTLEHLTQIIPGPPGTYVRLGFGNQDGSFVEVNLLRGTVSISQPASPLCPSCSSHELAFPPPFLLFPNIQLGELKEQDSCSFLRGVISTGSIAPQPIFGR